MWNRKQKVIQSINAIAEERYLNKKFLMEDTEDNGLPEFQVTPEGFGKFENKYKIKYTWKSKGVTLPKDARGDEIFKDDKFANIKNALTKIYTNQKEAQLAVDDIIRTKSSLFK
jgi:hypothetical protein